MISFFLQIKGNETNNPRRFLPDDEQQKRLVWMEMDSIWFQLNS